MKCPAVSLLLLLVLSQPAHAADWSACVVGVTDGDTITVVKEACSSHDLRHKQQERVRLASIDCPEKHQPFGQRAKQFTSDLVHDRFVTIREQGRDRYGRVLGEVILPNGGSLNRELVAGGFAWWYRRYAPDDRDLEKLEGEAREARRGLWSEPTPVPPWEWRSLRRK